MLRFGIKEDVMKFLRKAAGLVYAEICWMFNRYTKLAGLSFVVSLMVVPLIIVLFPDVPGDELAVKSLPVIGVFIFLTYKACRLKFLRGRSPMMRHIDSIGRRG